MTPATPSVQRDYCAACGDAGPLADFLVVTDRTGATQPFVVHRPSVRNGCFTTGVVGPAARFAISLADPAAAIASASSGSRLRDERTLDRKIAAARARRNRGAA